MSEVKLEEVLEEYAVATPDGNDLKVLREVAEKHPEYTEELEDFAAARAVARHAPEEELTDDEESRVRESAVTNLRAMLDSLAISQPPALISLTGAAKEKGFSRSKFADALGLSVSLVQYLEKRRLKFATVPQRIISRIAQVLNSTEEVIGAYLNQPPDYQAAASFKTQERAEEMPAKDFAEAVREDQVLSPEQKRKLLEP